MLPVFTHVSTFPADAHRVQNNCKEWASLILFFVVRRKDEEEEEEEEGKKDMWWG